MPQIIVIADSLAEDGTARVMLRERVTERDFESGHFAAQLAQRLGWAVGDAHAVDHRLRPHAGEVAVARGDEGISAENVSAFLGERRHHGLVHAGAVALRSHLHPRSAENLGLEGGVLLQGVGRQPEGSDDRRRVQVLA
jgi:hypothetical protein